VARPVAPRRASAPRGGFFTAGAWAIASALGAQGCAPAHDWRELRVEGTTLVALFPCRPQRHARTAELADAPLPMQLHVCGSAKQTWAIAAMEVAQPADVGPALQALRKAAAANIAASQVRTLALQVPGMTPNPSAALLTMSGVSAQGAAIRASAAFFARGLRVYQATVFGERVDPEAVEMFFSGLKLQ
jgi:hypothetical protein